MWSSSNSLANYWWNQVHGLDSHHGLHLDACQTKVAYKILTRNSEGRNSGSMRRFSHVIDELELKDFPLLGGPFTWKGGLNNQRMARLDRFLVIDDWDVSFEGARRCLLPRPTLDHFLVFLERGATQLEDHHLPGLRTCG